jgi:hypothetical protein
MPPLLRLGDELEELPPLLGELQPPRFHPPPPREIPGPTKKPPPEALGAQAFASAENQMAMITKMITTSMALFTSRLPFPEAR